MDKVAVTSLLKEIRGGNPDAAGRLFDGLQSDLRRLAAYYMKAERPGHTLQPTALVNEVYLKIFGSQGDIDWQDRAHFFAAAARHMRHILIDHARQKQAGKRGSGAVQVTLSAAAGVEAAYDLEGIHEALSRLEEIYPEPAKIVELKYFGGLTDREIAEVTGKSFAQVRRDWEFARAWLFHQLKG